MNYMEQVSKMLGLELEEEFNVSSFGSLKFKFTKNGIEYFHKPAEKWSDIGLLYGGVLYKILEGSYKIIKIQNPILDENEKEYLSAVIKPWRNSVNCIFKYGASDHEFIVIKHYNKLTEEEHHILLPAFKKGTMYKGMKFDKEYKLEEIGL